VTTKATCFADVHGVCRRSAPSARADQHHRHRPLAGCPCSSPRPETAILEALLVQVCRIRSSWRTRSRAQLDVAAPRTPSFAWESIGAPLPCPSARCGQPSRRAPGRRGPVRGDDLGDVHALIAHPPRIECNHVQQGPRSVAESVATGAWGREHREDLLMDLEVAARPIRSVVQHQDMELAELVIADDDRIDGRLTSRSIRRSSRLLANPGSGRHRSATDLGPACT